MKKYPKEIGTLNSADMKKFSTFREMPQLVGQSICDKLFQYFFYLLYTNDDTTT